MTQKRIFAGAVLTALVFFQWPLSTAETADAQTGEQGGASGLADNVRRGCLEAQTRSAQNQKAGVTALQINAYCTCLGSELAKAVTEAEIASLAATGTFPPSLIEKRDRIASSCVGAAR
jgi:hypothetical protein